MGRSSRSYQLAGSSFDDVVTLSSIWTTWSIPFSGEVREPALSGPVRDVLGELRPSGLENHRVMIDPVTTKLHLFFVLVTCVTQQATGISLVKFQLGRSGLEPLFDLLDMFRRIDVLG